MFFFEKKKNKWFPWAFWWNLFEFFCNGDLPMTFARPRFARRSLASLGWRPLKTVPALGRTLRGIAPPHRSVPHGPPLKVLWTSGVVPPEGKIYPGCSPVAVESRWTCALNFCGLIFRRIIDMRWD